MIRVYMLLGSMLHLLYL